MLFQRGELQMLTSYPVRGPTGLVYYKVKYYISEHHLDFNTYQTWFSIQL